MKTKLSERPFASRIIHGLIAICCIAATPSAFAVGKVGISLNGEVLAKGKSIHVEGNKLVDKSKDYAYEFKGRIRGKKGTPAAQFIPSGTQISDFIDSITSGGSRFLTGSFSNPSGKIPAEGLTVLDRKISGKRTVQGLGKVTFSLKLVGRIESDGTCVLDITNVKFKSTLQKKLGSIEFMGGSKLFISVAPVVTFFRASTKVDESVGTVSIPVKRTSNQRGKVTVNFTTVPGTADEGDFTPTSGTITFANRESSKDIVIPIIDNGDVDGLRTFTIEISDPSTGAVIGSQSSTTVKIVDNDIPS